MTNTFFHSGDLGDIIAALPTIRHMGGGKLLLGTRSVTKPMTDERFNAIAPLIRLQPYITSCELWHEETPDDITVDFSHFRRCWNHSQNLIEMQAVYTGLDPKSVSTEPWLTFPGIVRHNRIVIARSSRNQGLLQWFRIWQAKHEQIDYIGVRDEYEMFLHNNNPWPHQNSSRKRPVVPFKETRDLVEAIQWIDAARLFVTNQSSPLWLAWGCGKSPMIIECTTEDSTLLGRTNIRYVRRTSDNLSIHEVMHL